MLLFPPLLQRTLNEDSWAEARNERGGEIMDNGRHFCYCADGIFSCVFMCLCLYIFWALFAFFHYAERSLPTTLAVEVADVRRRVGVCSGGGSSAYCLNNHPAVAATGCQESERWKDVEEAEENFCEMWKDERERTKYATVDKGENEGKCF